MPTRSLAAQGRARLAGLGLAAATLVPAVGTAEQPKTYFDHVQHSWAVGAISLSREFKFRDGRLLAYPGRFVDLVHARLGNPRSIMFIYELAADEDAPPFAPDQPLFAPIEVLPRYKYWRDNLPKTPHHAVAGGRRYLFTGDDIGPASAAARTYAATLEMKGRDRWRSQNAVFVEAMLSGVEVLRQDGVRHLSRQLPLTRVLDDESVEKLGRFLIGDHPERERERVLRAIGRAGTKSMSGAVETLAARDDEVAAAALAVLAQLERPRTRAQLESLLGAKTAAVRAWAIEQLAAAAGSDGTALATAARVLAGDDAAVVRAGAATGLGRSGAAAAVPPLAQALARGDDASREAASALAAIGTREAIAALKDAANGSGTNTAVAAVLGLGQAGRPGQAGRESRREGREDDACTDCITYLEGLRGSHADPSVRDIIGIVLESAGDARE